MQIFDELNENKGLALALGYFDGVHIGHQAVIKSAVDFARQNNAKSAVITFKDHPYCFFKGVCPKYILSRKERERKIEQLGIDYIYELDFENICSLTADEYLNILQKNFAPISISTGENHCFGCNKSGDTEFLTQNANSYEYFKIPLQKLNGELINSTTIRDLLTKGDIEKANSMLNANFEISGQVVLGNQIGRTIGFNTANIVYPPELVELPYGVYEVETQYGKGIANFGIRPTVDGSNAVLETHILDFDKDIYGEILNVKFRKMIRKEVKFNSIECLKEQIKKDISTIYSS